MKVEFHSAARRELDESAAFYEDRAAHLGDEFVAEVHAATRRLAVHPNAGFPVSARLRR